MTSRKLVSCLIVASVLVPALLAGARPASAARPTTVASVLVFSRTSTSPLITSLRIDTGAIAVQVLAAADVAGLDATGFNNTLASADVFFVDRYLPTDPTFLALLASHVNGTLGHKGLVMFGIMEGDLDGPQVAAIAPLLPVQLDAAYQNSTADSTRLDYSIQIKVNEGRLATSEVLVRWIPWVSAPQVDRRTVIDARPGADRIIVDLTGSHAIVAEWQVGSTGARVMFFSMEVNVHNIGFSVWPYFNYLMYACTFHVLQGYDDALIEAFHEWPWAPLPDLPTIVGWFAMIGGLWVITMACFARYRKTWQARKATWDVVSGAAASLQEVQAGE